MGRVGHASSTSTIDIHSRVRPHTYLAISVRGSTWLVGIFPGLCCTGCVGVRVRPRSGILLSQALLVSSGWVDIWAFEIARYLNWNETAYFDLGRSTLLGNSKIGINFVEITKVAMCMRSSSCGLWFVPAHSSGTKQVNIHVNICVTHAFGSHCALAVTIKLTKMLWTILRWKNNINKFFFHHIHSRVSSLLRNAPRIFAHLYNRVGVIILSLLYALIQQQ